MDYTWKYLTVSALVIIAKALLSKGKVCRVQDAYVKNLQKHTAKSININEKFKNTVKSININVMIKKIIIICRIKAPYQSDIEFELRQLSTWVVSFFSHIPSNIVMKGLIAYVSR